MIAAPLSADEEARLTTLYNYRVLDSESEPAFDRLVQLAAAQLDAPIALISLVDRERQWFKAHFGLDACETGRDISFCSHVVAADELMVVGDARLDERFCDNPLVVGEPFIRFYAGAPLRSAEGHVLGTLCVIDTEPHAGLVAAKRQLLQGLANLAVDLLELRKSFQHLSHMAFHDVLTGLPNRRLFRDRLRQALAGAKRDRSLVAVALIDLDGFKDINDSEGHDAGDALLKRLAAELAVSLRARDTVARWGGDEFVCCMTLDRREELPPLLLRIEQAQQRAGIGGSVGVAIYPDDAASLPALLKVADAAMYREKEARRMRRAKP
jgi:diguanylate cyclase (GGDEF)-like protein